MSQLRHYTNSSVKNAWRFWNTLDFWHFEKLAKSFWFCSKGSFTAALERSSTVCMTMYRWWLVRKALECFTATIILIELQIGKKLFEQEKAGDLDYIFRHYLKWFITFVPWLPFLKRETNSWSALNTQVKHLWTPSPSSQNPCLESTLGWYWVLDSAHRVCSTHSIYKQLPATEGLGTKAELSTARL